MLEENYEDLLCRLKLQRRDFHKFAESGWREFRTTSIIADKLSKLGFRLLMGKDIIEEKAALGRPDEKSIQKAILRAKEQGAKDEWIEKMEGYTGVIGILDTGDKGPTIALRFDIDSNEIIEAEDIKHFPYREGFSSINRGAAHCCGHDGHASIGLGVAELLANMKDKLKGKVMLIFQPAEEGVRGAKGIVEKGVLDNVDYFLSGHIGLGVPKGVLSICTRGFLCTTKFDVEFRGVSAHAGAAPSDGHNAMLAAANAVINLNAIPRHKSGVSRINVGRLISGTQRNIIPSYAFMEVETRGGTTDVNSYMFDNAQRIIKGSAQMYDVKWSINKKGEAVDCKSDEILIHLAGEAAKEIDEISTVDRDGMMDSSEDASLMVRRVQKCGGKAAYFIFGTTLAAGHHNDWFDFDEDVMKVAVEVYIGVIKKILGQKMYMVKAVNKMKRVSSLN